MSTPSKEWIAEFIRWIDFGEELTTEDECNQVERAFAEASKKFPLPGARPPADPTAADRQRRYRAKHVFLTRIEIKLVQRLIRHGVPLSRHSIPPHDVRTGKRLERKGVVTYPDDGCFRLSELGRAWAQSKGLMP